MLKAVAFANAFTLVSVGLYVICRVLSLIAPDFLFNVGKAWFHTFSMNSLKVVTPLDLGTFLFGGVSLGLLTWVIAYSGVTLYNKWAK